MEERLFIILRLGIGTTTISDERISLFRGLSESKFEALRKLAFEQGVGGICFSGIQQVFTALGNDGADLMASNTYLQWMGATAMRAQLNEQQVRATDKFAKELGKQGIKLVLMKGQANGLNYPEPMHREKGDVDVFLVKDGKCAYDEGNAVAKQMGLHVDESWYKHSVIKLGSETVENHQYFVHTRDGKRGKDLDVALRELIFTKDYAHYPGSEILLPPVMFNALFLTYHGLAHFVSEGMHLKQVVDWAMFLKKESSNIDWNRFYELCDKFNLRVFLECMNMIAMRYLMVKGQYSVTADKSVYADKIMESILNDKDFVFNSGKSGWHNRWHLVTNLFKYRWKYEKVYGQSVWLQLWYYVSGFLFKTEE